MRFKNKVAVITGASTGIGYLTAESLAKEGAVVALLGTKQATINEAAKRISSQGFDALGYEVDVRDYSKVSACVDDLIAKYGHIDILVNCAGGASIRVFNRTEPFHEMPIEFLDWGIDVNLKGSLHMAHAVIGHMIEQKCGVIINVGSIDGQTGGAAIDYSAAKSGVMNGLTKSLALYGAPHGVRCCCVSPGPVLTRPAMAKMKTPLGRAAETHEVVDLILYLCSDQAAFITGSNYLIDGGRSCGAQN